MADIILLRGIAFDVIWFINFQKPENVVMHALANAVNQKAVNHKNTNFYKGFAQCTTSIDNTTHPPSLFLFTPGRTNYVLSA